MSTTNPPAPIQRIVVFEQAGSGQKKIRGIHAHGQGMEITKVFDLPADLPTLVDEPGPLFPADFEADLVLSFLKHPDLNEFLAALCQKKNVPMIASGTKTAGAVTPFTCCGLGRSKSLGHYAEQFGFPEYEATIDKDRVAALVVRRGASCGATWDVVEKVVGMTVDEALPTLAREIQYLCIANPRNFDPISGKSQLHYAGEVHIAALERAIRQATIPK